MPDSSIENAKNGVALVGELIKAAGDNPEVKEAGANLGKAALTITKTINNALLPLAAVNFAFDKARQYFDEGFQKDLSEKAASIPADELVEPKASIAGPALQGLAFSHAEPTLKDMYLSLLATAMDSRMAADAHPAFVELIKQLDGEEALLLQTVLKSKFPLPIAQIRVIDRKGAYWNILHRHLMGFVDSGTLAPRENDRLEAMVDNWIRLRLVEVDFSKPISPVSSYDWVERRPEYLRYKELQGPDKEITFARGSIERTALGVQFGRAVGLL